MPSPGFDDDREGRLDPDDEPERVGGFDDEAEVVCPHCGESSVIGLDPGGGLVQVYVEDCQVCCQPWQVEVSFDDFGTARVTIDRLD